jgi:gamma-glutamyltranspeptidase / glutathione hydrolase
MAIAGHREAAAAALGMLDDGGNACDAIVAAATVTAVVDPVDVAFGGSGFLLLEGEAVGGAWSAEFPSRAPAAATPAMFPVLSGGGPDRRPIGVTRVEGDLNRSGALACGVPGLPAGLIEAHARWGRLPLGRVLEPAVGLAHGGFPARVDVVLASLENLPELRADPGAGAVFLRDGLPLRLDAAHPVTGQDADRVLQPQLGRTLELLGRSGLDGWRRELAPRLAADIRERGGIVTEDDIAGYEPGIGRPLEHRVGDARLLTTNAPSGGWTVLQLLAVIHALGPGSGSPAVGVHRFVEASRHAFADRYAFFGDPPAVKLETLLSDARLGQVAGGISDRVAGLRFDDSELDPWIRFAGHQGGTAHLLAADAEGTLACCTVTAGDAFGSKLLSESTGVLLDNSMLWFDARPGFPNSIAPGKRPLTNMAPVIAGGPAGVRWAVGAPGGRRIPSAVAQVLLRLFDGSPPQEALDHPRVDASGRHVLVDADMDDAVVEYLEEAGHPVLLVDLEHWSSSYELARPSALSSGPDGRLSGGFDARSEGYVAA